MAESGEQKSGSGSDAKGVAPLEQIGEYIVQRMLGEGGMGRVYEAEERLSKRRVALKVLREELARSAQARAMFLNEMQILAHLEHPNIVRSLASVESEGKLVMVLEYLDGQTLRDVLAERERLSWEEAGQITAAVARGLSAAHGQEPPVIHRDLKPENIMLLEGGGVKVMDFGIAKLIQALDQTNTQSVGTLQYMSPEQIDAKPVGPWTDLYCLGLVLYELLTGRAPFSSASPRELLNLQCGEPPPPLPDDVRCPKGLQKLLFQLLEKNPDDRPASADEVVEILEDYLPEGGEVGSARRGASSRAKAPSSRSRDGGDRGEQQDTLPSGRDAEASEPVSEPRSAKSAKRGERKDTVALIEEATSEHELSTGLSVGIIAVLAVVSALATYAWRSSQEPAAPSGAAGSSVSAASPSAPSAPSAPPAPPAPAR